MKRKQKTLLEFLIVVFILLIYLALPPIKSFLNRTMNGKLIEKVDKYALSANIEIVQVKYSSGSKATSPGASGVIFRKEGNKYYALTAKHVIEKPDNVDRIQVIILGYQDLDLAASLRNGAKFQGAADYYQQFPEALVEYSNDKYDLAVISFTSNKDFTVLSVAEKAPQYGDKVAAMSNPNRKRNIVTAGKIISKSPSPFGDEAGKMQYPVIRHSAVISEGSSGSALLNEDLDIVGINLGGNENIFRQYISGMAMPSDLILGFLKEWGH